MRQTLLGTARLARNMRKKSNQRIPFWRRDSPRDMKGKKTMRLLRDIAVLGAAILVVTYTLLAGLQ